MHALSVLTWLRDLIALLFLCTAFGIVFTVIVYFVNTYTDLTFKYFDISIQIGTEITNKFLYYLARILIGDK